MLTTSSLNDAGYNGLTEHTEGLPAETYFDPRNYERELQRILLVRDDSGVLQGFHNTCRHRGAELCREPRGHLKSGQIVCPYHAWAYTLQGDLLRTTSKRHAHGFEVGNFPLYKVRAREWNGFIFVALTDDPPPFEKLFDLPIDRLDAWPLKDLIVGHVLLKTIQCNWKIYWENYNECLHCPGVHPKLSQLVPIYGRGLLEERDDPYWTVHTTDDDPKFKGGLRSGAATWSLDGRATSSEFPNLSVEDRKAGHIYMTGLPSMFIVGHVDYVRVVRLRPLGPEQAELRVEYLFLPQTLADPNFDLRNVVDFTDMVMTEDADICEVNQRGLHAAPHVRGVVMPEEYVLRQFHDWVRAELARV